jgi:transcriptional/translational regulatory protein YebC/TACO1
MPDEHRLSRAGPPCRRSAKIATRKGKADAQKAKLYGKIGKQIAQAVRQGGPDALANARLREALAAAKVAQVPTDIIDRNIKRASESKADYAEVTYEGGQAGAAVGGRWCCRWAAVHAVVAGVRKQMGGRAQAAAHP